MFCFPIVEVSPDEVPGTGANITPTVANTSVITIDTTEEIKVDGECRVS